MQRGASAAEAKGERTIVVRSQHVHGAAVQTKRPGSLTDSRADDVPALDRAHREPAVDSER